MTITTEELAPIIALNEETFQLVEKALSDYPCHIPHPHHMAVRTALRAVRSTETLQPEIAFFLGWTISNIMANKARYTIASVFQDVGQGVMFR